MDHDLDELRRIGGILSEALALLDGEHQRLSDLYDGKGDWDSVAGGPRQTLLGLGEMVGGVRESINHIALHVGFTVLGMEKRAVFSRGRLQMEPLCVPSGTDRMARPLGEATVKALLLLRELDGFYADDFGGRIDRALAASEATYPPTGTRTPGRSGSRRRRRRARRTRRRRGKRRRRTPAAREGGPCRAGLAASRRAGFRLAGLSRVSLKPTGAQPQEARLALLITPGQWGDSPQLIPFPGLLPAA